MANARRYTRYQPTQPTLTISFGSASRIGRSKSVPASDLPCLDHSKEGFFGHIRRGSRRKFASGTSGLTKTKSRKEYLVVPR